MSCSSRTRTSRRPDVASIRTTSPSANLGDRPAGCRLRGDVDGGRNLAGGAGHAPVGDEGYPVSAVLQGAERRGQLVQFGHAVGLRSLEADHRDEVAVELAARRRRPGTHPGHRRPRRAPRWTSARSSTADVFMTARPRFPCSTRRPPSGRRDLRRPAARLCPRCAGRAVRARRKRAVRASARLEPVGVQAASRDGRHVRRAAGPRRAARGSGTRMPPAAWKWFTSALPFG